MSHQFPSEPSRPDCLTVVAGGRVVPGNSINFVLTDCEVSPMPVGPTSDVTPKAMRPPVQKASLIGGFCLMAPWPPRVDSGKPSRED